MSDYIQVFVTTDKKENAGRIARVTVEKRLAACAQVMGPIRSTYWWDNRINDEEEWLLIIKTRGELFEELERAIKDIHPYEVPEILALPVVAGNRSYLDWLGRETITV